MKQEEVIIEHLDLKLVIPKDIADELNLDEVKQDFVRSVARIKNRYVKLVEKK